MTLLLTAVIVSIAFFGEAVFGFGGGLISIPLLSLILGVKTAVTLVLIFQLLLGLLIFHTYKITDWSAIKPALVPILLGTIIGTFSLIFSSEHLLNIVLALVIFVYLIKQLLIGDVRFGVHKPRLFAGIFGGFGGWLMGVLGTGGPAFVIYLNELGLAKDRFRATIILMFFLCNVVRIVTSISAGLFTSQVLTYAGCTLPIFLFALYLGHRTHFGVSQRIYEAAVYLVLTISAISLIYKIFLST